MIPSKKQSFTRLLEIAIQMRQQNISEDFVENVIRLAMDLDGICDLMILWADESNAQERDEIIADLQEEIESYQNAPQTVVEKPAVQLEQLDSIALSIIAYKKKIRDAVDRWGGITKLSRETGIPQPSLSRFFSTASMPRRTTLYRIAKAVGLKDSDITFEWLS
jgi:DNA-binding phage protein